MVSHPFPWYSGMGYGDGWTKKELVDFPLYQQTDVGNTGHQCDLVLFTS